MQAITPQVVARGIRYCISNAERYISSSKILIDNGDSQTAFLLILYSMEEMGKVILVWNVLFHNKTVEDFKKWKKRFKDHGEKFWFSRDLDDFMSGNVERELIKTNKRETKKAFLKQDVSYVGLTEAGFKPPKTMSWKQVKEAYESATKRLKFLKNAHPSEESDERNITEAIKELEGLTEAELHDLIKSKKSQTTER